MVKVSNENYILIQGWMIKELGLKGNELIVYAIIHGFSQAEDQSFNGSLQYLADWTKSTKQGVIKNLKNLQEKGFIEKKEMLLNGVKFCEYHSTKFNGGIKQSLTGYSTEFNGGIKQSLPNNILDNSNDNKLDKKESFVSIIDNYTMNEDLKSCLNGFVEMRKKMKGFTIQALKMNLKNLDKLALNDDLKISIVNQSVMNGWKAFYPLKQQQQQAEQQTSNPFVTMMMESGVNHG